MGKNYGGCPLAHNSTYQLLSSRMRSLYGKMRGCHTADRDNLVAFPDCAFDQTSDWSEAVNAKMEIEIFP
jgi:hypothetical protein